MYLGNRLELVVPKSVGIIKIFCYDKMTKKLFTLRQQISSFWRLTFFSKKKNNNIIK